MFPFELLSSEASAANLPQQVRWREGLQCPRCRSESVIKHGSYREYQRYLCKDCDRTFNDKTGTIFAHAKIGLTKLLFTFYSLLRFNTSIRQLDAEIDVSYRSLRRRVEQFARTLDAPAISSLARSGSTSSTSLPERKAASATGSRARVASRNVVAEATRKTSHQYSHSLIAAAVSDMLSRRNPLTKRPCDSFSITARRVADRPHRRISGLRPAQRR